MDFDTFPKEGSEVRNISIMKKIMLLVMAAVLSAGTLHVSYAQDPKCKKECCKKCDAKCEKKCSKAECKETAKA